MFTEQNLKKQTQADHFRSENLQHTSPPIQPTIIHPFFPSAMFVFLGEAG